MRANVARMRILLVVVTLLVAASGAWAEPTTPVKQVCFASGVAGSPLDRCLLVDERKTSWGERLPRDERHERAFAKRWFPVRSRHVGWTETGEKRTVRVRAHHFEYELGIPMIEFDREVALVTNSPSDLRVVPAVEAKLTDQELSTLTELGGRLLEQAIKSCPPDWPVDGRFEVRQPKVVGVPGTPGLRAVFLPLNLSEAKKGSGSVRAEVPDDRGAFFFLLNGNGEVTFSRFGHGEWTPSCSAQIAKIEPLFFFHQGEDDRTFMVARFEGPWESWGLVALIDPVRAEVVSF